MWKNGFLIFWLSATPALSQDKSFDLQAPEVLFESGLLKHLLPRFSLKTGIRIQTTDTVAEAAFGPEGVAVFRQGDTVWHFTHSGSPDTRAFEDWLRSDVGKRTIEAFAPDGEPVFSAEITEEQQTTTAILSGDIVLGQELSLFHCGRCHVVNNSNRMKAIGSSPSFALMRGFADWQERFETFFMRKPHPAFTQITDVTEPFAQHLPSPIAPVEITMTELDAITAFVSTIPAADLGAPLKSQ